MMKNLNEIDYDNISKEKLNILVIDLINKYNNKEVSNEKFLDDSIILTNISLFSYVVIGDNEKKMLSNLLYNFFFNYCIYDSNKYRKIDRFYYIIVNLGLQECYDKIYDTLFVNSKSNKNIENIFYYCKRIYAANGCYISNPFNRLGR